MMQTLPTLYFPYFLYGIYVTISAIFTITGLILVQP